MAPLEKLRMKGTFWCFPGAGGSGSAFHEGKERKKQPKKGVFWIPTPWIFVTTYKKVLPAAYFVGMLVDQ